MMYYFIHSSEISLNKSFPVRLEEPLYMYTVKLIAIAYKNAQSEPIPLPGESQSIIESIDHIQYHFPEKLGLLLLQINPLPESLKF